MNVREWALPVYTILMQLATGTLFILWLIRALAMRTNARPRIDKVLRRPVLIIFFTVLVAIIGSHFHLSNPLQSFLAVLNVKNSWLSREVVFNILMVLTCAALVDQLWKYDGKHTRLITGLGWAGIVFGGASIYCMARIYLLPTQAPWNNYTTILLFFGSSLLLGVTSAGALGLMDIIFGQEHEPELIEDRRSILKHSLGWMAGTASAVLILILTLNVTQILTAGSGDGLAQTSMSLLLGLYRPLLILRFGALFGGVVIFIYMTYCLLKKDKDLKSQVTPAYLACLLVLVAEILGRFLFYASHVRLGI